MKVFAPLATFLALFSNPIQGDKTPRSLIKGGNIVTDENKHPYFPIVLGRREFENDYGNSTDNQGIFCGGVLIAEDVVMTIGHCIDREDLVAVRCIFEIVDLFDSERLTIEAKSWIFDDSQDQDRALGLIFLEREVNFEPKNIMFDDTRPLQGDQLVIMGFGHTEENGTLSENLREDTIEVNFTSLCNKDFNNSIANEQQFCAGGNGTGACIGDSGNPAINEAGEVAGIVSYGFSTCGVMPTVFTRVGAYTDWIKENVCGRSNAIDPAWCSFKEPVPSFGGDEGGFFACFSGSGKVEVRGKDGNVKTVAMKELSIGDNINVGNDIYEPVYSFGHHSPSAKADMLEIKTGLRSTLRLSPNHMLMVASKGTIPASQVKVGDQLFTSSGNMERVRKIDNVVGHGLYAPFTPSGKVVVDGILASSYIALEDSNGLELMGGWLKVSHQWMAHAGSFPHRMVCYYNAMRRGSNYCEGEKYSAEGISEGVYRSLLFYDGVFETANNSRPLIRSVFFAAVMVGLITFTLIETIITNPITFLVTVLFALCISGLSIPNLRMIYKNPIKKS